MALEHRPAPEHLAPQAQALLEGFARAGKVGLTTNELLNFTYEKKDKQGKPYQARMGDWRARKSDLKKAGWVFKTIAQEDSTGYVHILTNFKPDLQLPLQLNEAAA